MRIIPLLILLSLGFSNLTNFSFGEVNLEDSRAEIVLENEFPINHFELRISGASVDSVFGGIVETMNFDINIGGHHDNRIFGMNWDTEIPAGTHSLLWFEFEAVHPNVCIFIGQWGQGQGENFHNDSLYCFESDIPPPNQNYFFNNMLNGHFHDYVQFQDSTGYGEVQSITVEFSDDLDFGDDIGLLSYSGQMNYGECSDEEFGQIVVGAGTWQDAAISICAFPALDVCDELGIELPGFVVGDLIAIHVWDQSEQQEYVYDYILRDEAYFGDENIIIENMVQSDPVIPQGDLNGDFYLDIADILLIVNAINLQEEFEAETLQLIDINNDENVDILDIVGLLVLILG